MKIAIHQPNFIPWLPYFYKMAMVDVFVLLNHVQFEKNGFQNRFKYKDKWITKPVVSGLCNIADKKYVDGQSLVRLNRDWIEVIARTLGIKSYVFTDKLGHKNRPEDKTMKLVDIIKTHTRGRDEVIYVTNESAKDKYLDENMMKANGIDIEYCKVPKNLHISIFEAFEMWGIEGTIKQLPKKEQFKACMT